PEGVVTSKGEPLVQKAKPEGVVTSKVDPLVQKAKPAGVITSKVDPLVQKVNPAGVVTSKGDPLVELTKADHATELSHLTELLEKKYHLSSRNNLVNRYHQMYILMLKNCLNWEQIVEF
ncbi:MAG: hypothetical protein N4P72_00005, partial [Lactobacillus iners]|nr:hypothetical protein [Lactobacillus iners]